jgi:hypothetical protein
MTDEMIGALPRRMIEDMTVRGFTACAQRGYVAAVKTFTVFLGRSPDQATIEDRVAAPKGTETLSEPCQAKSTGFLCEK